MTTGEGKVPEDLQSKVKIILTDDDKLLQVQPKPEVKTRPPSEQEEADN